MKSIHITYTIMALATVLGFYYTFTGNIRMAGIMGVIASLALLSSVVLEVRRG